ncbi:MAG: putative toxin-antitoxin system toxin component, PIN family [Saprospiraceae bacterium]|nr:putative toxin-antitoxin system toxin component, PIN family [Saprospiraceae bacterium]
MNVVLDTNVLLVAVSERSPFHWIITQLENGAYNLCVTTDILVEYSEILQRHMGVDVADLALKAILQLPNLIFVEKYFFWQLIPQDPDDNKFVDCAIAASAKYIVSEDRHIKALPTDKFFTVEVLGIAEFKTILAQ